MLLKSLRSELDNKNLKKIADVMKPSSLENTRRVMFDLVGFLFA